MKRPQATAQMADAVRAGAPELASDEEDDEEETRGFGVQYSHPAKKQRRGSGCRTPRPRSPHGGQNRRRRPRIQRGEAGHRELLPPRATAPGCPPAPPLFSTPARPPSAPSRRREENFPPGGAAAAGGGSARGARGIAHRAEHELMALEQGLSNAKRQADDAPRDESGNPTAPRRRPARRSCRLSWTRRASASRARRAAKDAELRRVDGVKALAVKVAQFERERSRRAAGGDRAALGSVSVPARGGASEVWEDGGTFAALDERARRRRRRRRTSSARRSSATCRFRARTPLRPRGGVEAAGGVRVVRDGVKWSLASRGAQGEEGRRRGKSARARAARSRRTSA